MSMMFGNAWGGYCLGFTEVNIRFVFDDSFFYSFFMLKSYTFQLWVFVIITLLTKFSYATTAPVFL